MKKLARSLAIAAIVTLALAVDSGTSGARQSGEPTSSMMLTPLLMRAGMRLGARSRRRPHVREPLRHRQIPGRSVRDQRPVAAVRVQYEVGGSLESLGLIGQTSATARLRAFLKNSRNPPQVRPGATKAKASPRLTSLRVQPM